MLAVKGRILTIFNHQHRAGKIPGDRSLTDISNSQWLLNNAEKTYKRKINIVARLASGDGQFLVKVFGWRHWIHRVLSPFMVSRAWQSWRVARALIAAGVGTPAPRYVFTGRCCGFITSNLYISDYITGHRTIRRYLKSGPPEEQARQAVRNCARNVAHMHSAGIMHRDLTPGNFLLDQDLNIYLVDLNRARIRRRLSYRQIIRDLAKINFGAYADKRQILIEEFMGIYAPASPYPRRDWLADYHQYRQGLLRRRRLKRKLKKLGFKQ